MTKCAGVEPLLPGQMTGIDNEFSDETVGRMGGMPGDMAGGIAVATSAADTQDDGIPVIGHGAVVVGVKVGCGGVAFHALSGDLFVEIDNVGRIAGAIAPRVGGRIPGDGQLKEPVVIPI